MAGLIVGLVLVLFALFVAARTVRIIPQARAGVVERLGRYSRTLTPGLTIVVPFIDKVRPLAFLAAAPPARSCRKPALRCRKNTLTYQPAPTHTSHDPLPLGGVPCDTHCLRSSGLVCRL